MLADFLSKPLQGSLFRKFHDVLLGHAHLPSLHVAAVLPGEEHVDGRSDVNGYINGPAINPCESQAGLVTT